MGTGTDGPTVGLVVNPDGGASVSDNYAKRRTGECVLAGPELAADPVEALVMPDRASIGQRLASALEDEPERPVGVLEQPVTGTADDTVAGAAAALLATGAVDPTETTVRHGTVRATIGSGA
ncbi:hypothetical protein [Natronobeatus ordinarius]|uniref:hypothetical protein n=1 Tax=Natronobeatus ordinarius TaxID=2963433 RepID=UPI0020CB7D70|nr:hypothetical protein [Natronobeatus ordinarius]